MPKKKKKKTTKRKAKPSKIYDPTDEILRDVHDELRSAELKFAKFNSAHEGWAVIIEELDELWEQIRGAQDVSCMRQEAIQIAAMGVRFAKDICHDFYRDDIPF